jgi:hypothetical protein
MSKLSPRQEARRSATPRLADMGWRVNASAPLVRTGDAAVRDGEAGDGLTLDGYSTVFNSVTIIDSWEGRFKEQFLPGSMKASFRAQTPVVQFDHGRHAQIGSLPIAAPEAGLPARGGRRRAGTRGRRAPDRPAAPGADLRGRPRGHRQRHGQRDVDPLLAHPGEVVPRRRQAAEGPRARSGPSSSAPGTRTCPTRSSCAATSRAATSPRWARSSGRPTPRPRSASARSTPATATSSSGRSPPSCAPTRPSPRRSLRPSRRSEADTPDHRCIERTERRWRGPRRGAAGRRRVTQHHRPARQQADADALRIRRIL